MFLPHASTGSPMPAMLHPVFSRVRRSVADALLVSAALLASACGPPESPPFDEAAWRRDVAAYRAIRIDSLTSDVSWLTLTGLYWLEPGDNTVGTDTSNTVVVPASAGASSLGTFSVGDSVRFVAAPGTEVFVDSTRIAEVTLRSDSGAPPTVLRAGTVRLSLLKRPRGRAIRVRDLAHPMRVGFTGLAHFDPDPSWRLDGRFERYDPPKAIRILDVMGAEDEKKSPGAVVFTLDGTEHRIDAITDSDTTTYWLIFKDASSGAETYGAGRYLHVPRPDARGRLIVDFNLAYNPPCAYTRFATCPLPPPQNKLDVRVLAGEKRFPGEKQLYAQH